MSQPVFRFAPSPTGFLHLGHAYAALYNQKICKAHNGKMLLRMENTDVTRCRPGFETAILGDLEWMGFEWHGDVRRQCEHFPQYDLVMEKLKAQGLIYPATMTRGQIRQKVLQLKGDGEDWPHDPDGAPFYPGSERELDDKAKLHTETNADDYALRLNMYKAMDWVLERQKSSLMWREFDVEGNATKEIACQPELWGDVVLGRKDIPARYHLACVIDDELQGITHVVRGMDIHPATSIHRLLQEILGYTSPLYCHHKLLVDDTGRKLSKRQGDHSIQAMRKAGMRPCDIHEIIGISP